MTDGTEQEQISQAVHNTPLRWKMITFLKNVAYCYMKYFSI